MKIKEVNRKKYMKILSESLMFLFLTAPLVLLASAALQAVGPVNPGNGFPLWYMDSNGLQLEPCLENPVTGIADPVCGLVAEPGFNPALPIALPGNFPSEFFYELVTDPGIDIPAQPGLPVGGRAVLVFALEGAFSNGPVAVGEQAAFGRIRIVLDAPVNGTYTVTHPYGVDTFVVDAPGVAAIKFTEDIGCFGLVGFPCNFNIPLISRIGPFLTQVNPPPIFGAGYVGDGVSLATVTGSPFGTNFIRIVGPATADLDAITPGIQNTFQTNQFIVMGRIFPGAGNITGTKINDDNANGIRDGTPLEGLVPNWNITIVGQTTGLTKNTKTIATGFYEFLAIPPDTYTVTEELKPGWTNTTPISKTAIVTNAGTAVVDFTNLLVRHGVTTSVVPPTSKTTTLGVPATYTIIVNNTGNLQDTFTLTTTAPENTVVTLSQPSITIPALGSGTVTLGVTSNTAVSPPPFTVSVTATSQGDPTVTATTVPGTTTEVLGIIVRDRIAMLKPGETMTFNASETVNITFSATSGIIVPGAVPGTAIFTAGATPGPVTITATNTTITPTPVGATGTATVFVGANRSTSQALAAGYNQVIVPVSPDTAFTASRLVQLIKAQTTIDALKVVRWVDAKQKFEAFDSAAGVGIDFPIEGGKVYFIKMSSPGAVVPVVGIVGTITGIS